MENDNMKFTEIDMATYKGGIPNGSELVIAEGGDIDSAMILYGFDEVDTFPHGFKNPVVGFITL
tara:strand:+ start:37 stop:228 length:192 start_codon:yes stop_codon:yes gene_type:complete